MKIGVLTHHYVNNYGAFLQAYCLRSAIADLFPGDEVVIVNYINVKHWIINTGGFVRFNRRRETIGSWLQKVRIPFVFARARRKRLKLTRAVYSVAGLNALKLDAIVVGSDEVWNYRDKKSYLPVKFGCGVDPAVRLVSYAASVGGVREFADRPKEIDAGLNRFLSVAARDANTARFVRELLGKEAVRVLDPVFLHKIPSEMSQRVSRLTAQPYILFYHCAPLSEQSRASVVAYAKENGLRLLGAGEYDVMYSEMSQDLSPFEWAELFRRADYVITGTFHGAVFSIVNERQMSVCPNIPARAEKLASLLEEFGLSSRLVSADSFDMKSASAAKIAYGEVRERVRQKEESSKEYLRSALAR